MTFENLTRSGTEVLAKTCGNRSVNSPMGIKAGVAQYEAFRLLLEPLIYSTANYAESA